MHEQSIQTQKDQQFFQTLKRYAQRLSQQKNASLNYLQTINRLTQQLAKRDDQIHRLTKQNYTLKQKLSVYEAVLSRSRVNSNPMKISNIRLSSIINKENITESIIQTVNEQDYQNYQKGALENYMFSNKVKSKQIHAITTVPIFHKFFVIKPTQNKNVDNNKNLKFIYHFNESHVKNKQSKLWEGILTYLCYNQGPDWSPQQYKSQILKNNNQNQPNNVYLYLSNSEQTLARVPHEQQAQFTMFNPSFYYFGICVKHKTLQYINGKLHRVPVIYGFITMFPLVRHFKNLLNQIITTVNFTNDLAVKELQQNLQHLKSLPFRFDEQMKFKIGKQQILWMIPEEQAFLDNIILEEFKSVFSEYNLELIIDIPIAIISTNQELLVKFMMYFVYIIKPLKYPFPIVFNLPSTMKILLQSPFPTFIGCTDFKIIEPYLFQRAVFDLDEKMAKSWPNLSFYNNSRDFILEQAHKKMGNNDLCIDKVSQIIQMLIEQNYSLPLSQYQNFFRQTQIWNIYHHHQLELKSKK